MGGKDLDRHNHPMSQYEQILSGGGSNDDLGDVLATGGLTQVSAVDDILDDIDAVLETNAAAFVEGFVQKGGQ